MKAFIYTGGSIEVKNITEHPKSDDLCIAADSGYKNALLLGEKPTVLLGDFDSYKEKLPDNIKIIKVPEKKDFTDTQLAINEALERGADEIVIIGGLDGYTEGDHGYHPDKGPRPPFIAFGPDIKTGVTLEGAELVDGAPTYARILEIEMPDVDGRALSELIKGE